MAIYLQIITFISVLFSSCSSSTCPSPRLCYNKCKLLVHLQALPNSLLDATNFLNKTLPAEYHLISSFRPASSFGIFFFFHGNVLEMAEAMLRHTTWQHSVPKIA